MQKNAWSPPISNPFSCAFQMVPFLRRFDWQFVRRCSALAQENFSLQHLTRTPQLFKTSKKHACHQKKRRTSKNGSNPGSQKLVQQMKLQDCYVFWHDRPHVSHHETIHFYALKERTPLKDTSVPSGGLSETSAGSVPSGWTSSRVPPLQLRWWAERRTTSRCLPPGRPGRTRS